MTTAGGALLLKIYKLILLSPWKQGAAALYVVNRAYLCCYAQFASLQCNISTGKSAKSI
jgi:hypothetical protein